MGAAVRFHSNDSTAESTDDSIHTPQPTHDEISRLARSDWLERREEEGTAEEDWYRAEEHLRRHRVETHSTTLNSHHQTSINDSEPA